MTRKRRWLAIIGPGMLVAATGVGAGDLATGAFAGSKLGIAVLWAVLVGAGLKFLLNEGLARWQLATGSTILEGSVRHFGRPVQWLFLGYLLIWSFFVATALMSACGVTAHAILPLFDPRTDKICYGIVHSAAGLLLVRFGGYALFARIMSGCVAVMFAVVIATAVAVRPDWGAMGAGLFIPTIPQIDGDGVQWTIALMGGVGGTLTILSYAYWIREEGRLGAEELGACRLDLAVGYGMTALFGLSMVIIGSRAGAVSGGGANLVVALADHLETALFPAARWAFLIGAWVAVFSSLLGVWQSVPYLFADLVALMGARAGEPLPQVVDERSRPYRLYLYALATLPLAGLFFAFERAQKLYAIIGALFIPLLALALLVLNGRAKLVGERFRSPWYVSLLLIAAVAFFLFAGWLEVQKKLGL